MTRTWLAFALLCAPFVQLSAAPEPPVTAPGLLVGEWQTPTGASYNLRILSDKTVLLVGGKLRDGSEAGLRLGRCTGTGRGLWAVAVRDAQDWTYNYNVVLTKEGKLNLLDGKGNTWTLQRMKVDFDKFDRNRDGLLTEDELADTPLVRKLLEFTPDQPHQLDRQSLARFLEKYPHLVGDK